MTKMNEKAEFVTLGQLVNHYDGLSKSLVDKIQDIFYAQLPTKAERNQMFVSNFWDKFSEEQQSMINKALENQWEPHFEYENLGN